MDQRYVCDCLKNCECSHEDIEKYQNHRQPNRYLTNLDENSLMKFTNNKTSWLYLTNCAMKSKRRQYMEIIKNKQFDEERALYNSKNVTIDHCLFAGIRDGESVLKESRNIEVFDSSFSLRYPLWHVDTFVLKDSSLDEKTRAAIWYSKFGTIDHTKIFGIKAIRECQNIQIRNCQIQSNEFGWKSKDIELIDSSI